MTLQLGMYPTNVFCITPQLRVQPTGDRSTTLRTEDTPHSLRLDVSEEHVASFRNSSFHSYLGTC